MKDISYVIIQKEKRKIEIKYHCLNNNSSLLVLIFNLFFIIIIKDQNNLTSCLSSISLVVDKTFKLENNIQELIRGNSINVNGINRSKDRYLNLSKEMNDIVLTFDDSLTSSNDLFKDMASIISADLSNFTITHILNMSNMFSGCSNLKKIIFGDSEVTRLLSMNSMFKNCSSLIYLKLFKLPERNNNLPSITIKKVFDGINPNVRYCITDAYTKNYLLGRNGISLCSDTCINEMNTKIDLVDNICVESCPNERFVYKNMDICYGECPKDSYPLFYDENEYDNHIRECFDEAPEFYYFDNFTKYYKKCHENCKYCYGEGNKSNHNCIECKSNYIFYNDLINISNCYEICIYFYYFDESNNFHCSRTCPDEYKLIKEKKKCINQCKNDDIYINEYNNTCFQNCPHGTYELEDIEDNKCYDKAIDGYYLDLNDEKIKKCYETCSTCNKGGNSTNNNCLECKTNYIAYNNSMNITNCYEKCEKYYYIDELELYHCVDTCPIKYNKLILNSGRCLDNCKNDDNYPYEYKNNCYNDCPNGTIKDKVSYICNDITNIKNIQSTIVIKTYEKDSNSLIDKKTDYTNEKRTDNIENKNENLNNIVEFVNNTNNNDPKIKDEVLERIKDLFNNGFDTSNIDKGKDFIINVDEVKYSITTTINQKYNNKKNESTINLGECEDKLKENYSIPKNDTLYLLKIDAFIDNVFKVEYEVYYPFESNNFTKLDLSVCSGIKIDISIPINISQEEIDKFNKSSGLYNDICYSYTSKSGTDKTLKDRQEEFKKNNIAICEENCEFTDYNNETKKAICSCFTKIELPIISAIKVDKKQLFSNFKNIKNVANFKMLKCIHLIFNMKNIFNNTANYMMLFLYTLSKIALFVFMCYNNIKIKEYINKFSYKNQKENDNKINNDIKKSEKNKESNDNKPIGKSNILTMEKDKNNLIQKNSNLLNINLKSVNKNKIIIDKNEKSSQRKLKNKNNKIKPRGKNNKKTKKIILEDSNKRNNNFKKKEINANNEKIKMVKKMEKLIKNISNISYNDIEMNSFDYEDAKAKDNRTYCQYYKSLLKTKHFLIFSFFLLTDYNPQIIKIYIFFFTFAINYLVSAMFYTDETIHKISEDEGSFDFTYQLPIMFYSLIISNVLKILLNLSGLYEDDIIKYKNDKKKEIDPKKLLCKIRCKVVLFFLITDLFLFFFWIYLGCFCAVYKNTQIHLLIDVSSSFGLSFITPIFIYLLPGIFRIPSLSKDVNRPLMFKFSKLLQLL